MTDITSKYHSYAVPVFLASTAETPASRSLGSLMYWRNAALCQQPSVWIVESSTPAMAAVVAAPIRKLCPAYCCRGRPTAVRISRSCSMNHAFRAGCVAARLKNTPAAGPLTAMYLRIAVTGHNGRPVDPTMMSAPVPNWSHLDRFRWNLTIDGFSRLSTATSPHMREAAGLILARDSGRSSLRRKKPKKAVQQTAHMSSLCAMSAETRCALIRSMTGAVMGRRRRDDGVAEARTR